jgi:tRNA pseudouridine13 synthase
MGLPHLTAALPGTGGALRARDEDFAVEEIPSYLPSGQGDHVFAWVEKRGLTTAMAAESLAGAVGVRVRDLGWAGMKDRRAVTRQWFSLPPPVTPEQVAAIQRDGLTVLEARRHPHKLRTGHLRGNRFVLRVSRVGDPTQAAARAEAILARLAEAPGAPNWFGEQRFGRDGDNAAIGRALITGVAPERRVHPRDLARNKRLYISALQSELFNRWLERRLGDELYRVVIAGDLLQKRFSGGMFPTEAPDVDQARMNEGEIVVTGPMFGHRMRGPAPGTAAADREAEILAEAGLAAADFARVGALGEGTRRPLAIAITDAVARPAGDDAIDVSFALPAGAYATAVMREVMKIDGDEATPGASGESPLSSDAGESGDPDASDPDAADSRA